jgi:hypothetical protein
MNWRHGGIATLVTALMLVVSTSVASADGVNPGVFAIDSHPAGMTYGQWSERWWQWALSLTSFDNCPNESGPMWFLTAPTRSRCAVPADTPIMFPTFNVEWSAVEANTQGGQAGTQGTCLVPTQPNGATYAALLACSRAQANNATLQGATLEADVDGRVFRNLLDYRAHSGPPPFTLTAVSTNLFGLPPGPTKSVADGFWIILQPLSPGIHRIHFAATVPFRSVNPPLGPFTFTTEANYCLVVQPSNQACS